jgi:hypothetical protein
VSAPQPVDRTSLVLALFAFGLVNLAVILYFAGVAAEPVVTGLLVVGVLCGVPAWMRLRR